jgi:hypothetical protein
MEITTPYDGSLQIIIYNALGAEVLNCSAHASTAKVDVESLLPGMYFMNVYSGNVRSVVRFVKQ